ncbi:MAG: HD domain-containing protein [Candidatus Saganbacteria bacterium]|nr:HD domain-containing protein [Candidatus Saganbacteria bacterium]
MSIISKYETLKSMVKSRKKDFDDFVNMLETETSWLTSPASTRFHLNKEGGLLEHSVGVAETLLKIKSTLAPELSDETCVIVGLFHDVGKIGMPGKPRYIKNENEWETKNRNLTYKVNPDEVYMNLAVRSLYIASKYMPLSDAEAQAILYHDGQFIEANHEVAHKEEPLTLLLQFADSWTAHIYEDGRMISEDKNYYKRK